MMFGRVIFIDYLLFSNMVTKEGAERLVESLEKVPQHPNATPVDN